MAFLLLLCLSIPFLTSTAGLYLWYRCIMWLIERRHVLRERSLPLYYLGVLLGYIGLVGDSFYHLTFGTLIFLEIPRELTLSARMKRLKARDKGWRGKLAKYVCNNILNPYDPDGVHC